MVGSTVPEETSHMQNLEECTSLYPATKKRSSVSSGADWKQILERPWQERACHQRVIMLLRGDLDVVVIVLE